MDCLLFSCPIYLGDAGLRHAQSLAAVEATGCQLEMKEEEEEEMAAE